MDDNSNRNIELVPSNTYRKEEELVSKQMEELKGTKPTIEFFSFYYDLVR